MKKHILPPVIIFTIIILGACFVRGNFNVFEWDTADRALVLLFNGFGNLVYGMIRHEQNESKSK